MDPVSSAHSSQMWLLRSWMLLLFCWYIHKTSSVALLRAVFLRVMIGNSLERSYLFTTPNFLIVYAGVPSGQCGLTFSPSVEVPLSRISLHMSMKISSALAIVTPPFIYSIYHTANLSDLQISPCPCLSFPLPWL